MNQVWGEAYKKKLISPSEIASWSEETKSQGLTIATLNGSFDLLHAGHLYMIYEASKQGDILLVALNSDASVKRYKSPHRPIVPLEYRLQMMAALSFVDGVTWFDETEPSALLKKIKPNVHVNGEDWKGKSPEEKTVLEFGGRVVYLPLIPGLSTTDILKKIQTLPTLEKVSTCV